MKNKHRIKQGLSLLLAGGIALTNLGAVMPAFAEDAAATPETAEAVTPETAEADTTAPNLVQITENLYNDLPDAPTGSYLGSMGLPVATGETKIGISAWVSDLYDGVDAHMDADALNADENTVTIGKTPGTDYAIVPLLAQVEYPADGAVSEIILPDSVELAIQKAVANTRKTVAAVRSAIRNFLANLHSLVVAIATGISVALGIVIVISLVAFVSGSAYGIFFAANAPNAASVTVREAVETLTAEYRDRLEEISETVQHDRQDITANDDVYYIRWQDVLAVFSSYVSGNEQGAPVAALTEEQVDKLREIMWAMNAVNCSTRAETAVIETTDKNGKETTTEITETVLVIELTHKTPGEMATDYHFTARQNNYLQLLQDPQYEQLWAELLGGFAQGGGKLMNPDSTRTPTGTLQWPLPVAGTITSQFGHRVDPITGEVSSHTGTDIACAEGTPILAAADGTVIVANGLDSWGGSYGYYIQIDHGGGLETLYAHCSSICVTTGQQVQAGEVIGYVGHTGRVTGNHLHFETRLSGSRINPIDFFDMRDN